MVNISHCRALLQCLVWLTMLYLFYLLCANGQILYFYSVYVNVLMYTMSMSMSNVFIYFYPCLSALELFLLNNALYQM